MIRTRTHVENQSRIMTRTRIRIELLMSLSTSGPYSKPFWWHRTNTHPLPQQKCLNCLEVVGRSQYKWPRCWAISAPRNPPSQMFWIFCIFWTIPEQVIRILVSRVWGESCLCDMDTMNIWICTRCVCVRCWYGSFGSIEYCNLHTLSRPWKIAQVLHRKVETLITLHLARIELATFSVWGWRHSH